MNQNFKPSNEYTPVIGLEIHVQLKTKSKMFCDSPNNPDETSPNTNICEICTGQPGTLPVANREAVRLAVMVGQALNCKIDEFSKFDRKNYFYPDLPKGYQISQYDTPIAKNGWLDIEIPLTSSPAGASSGNRIKTASSSAKTSADGGASVITKRIRIRRAHLEEDAGKNIHPEGQDYSLVDFNRAGTPLLEIVTEPDIESAKEARIFLQELRNIVRYIGASSADMEKGTMRLEPNISVRKPLAQELPDYKVEVKNINSFRFAENAIEYEIARQTEILKEGGRPKQVTMGWNERASQTVEQREKEEANDYRYFPEPDLPILHFSKEYLEETKAAISELPAQKRARFKEEYNLPDADIRNLIEWKELTEFFEAAVSEVRELDPEGFGKYEKTAANWCLQDFSAFLNAAKINPQESKITPHNFAELLILIGHGKISATAGKQILAKMFELGGEPAHIIEDLGLAQVSDEDVIEAAIDKIMVENSKAVADYRSGQQKSFGFLVGMAMKELRGKGNPQVVNEILKKRLNN